MDSHPVKNEYYNGYQYNNPPNSQTNQNNRYTYTNQDYNPYYNNNRYQNIGYQNYNSQNNGYQQRRSNNNTDYRNNRSRPYNAYYNNQQNRQNYYNNYDNRSYQNNQYNNNMNNNQPKASSSCWTERSNRDNNDSWIHPCDNKIVNDVKREAPPPYYTSRAEINRNKSSWTDNVKYSLSQQQQQQYTTKKIFGRQRFNPSSNGEDTYVPNKLIFNQPRSKMPNYVNNNITNSFTSSRYDESKNDWIISTPTDDITPTKTPTTEDESRPYRATPKTIITDDKLAKLYTMVKKTFLNITIKLNKAYPNTTVNDVIVKIHDGNLIDITVKDEIIVKNEETFSALNDESTVISIDENTSQIILFFKLKQRGMWSCFFKNEAINVNSVRVFDSQETRFTTHGLGYEITTPTIEDSESTSKDDCKNSKYPYEYKQDSEYVTITFKNIHPSITTKEITVYIRDENLKIVIDNETALEGILYSTYYKDYSYRIDRNVLTVQIHKSVMFQKWDQLFKKVIVGCESFGDEEVVVIFVNQSNEKKKRVIYTSDEINSTILAEKIINDQCKIGPKTYLRCLKDIVIPFSSISVYLCSRSDSYIEYTGPNEILTYMVGKSVYGNGVVFLYDTVRNKLVSINDSYTNIIFEKMDRNESSHVVQFYSAGCQT